MNTFPPGKHTDRVLYRWFHLLFRLTYIIAIVGLSGFLFLRIHGIPEPLLRKGIKKVNQAGIPVDVDRVTLTFRGWRADGVRYYSKLPDDLAPVFVAKHVFFDHKNPDKMSSVSGWSFDLEASDVLINPSIGWGVDIPKSSPLRKLDRLQASISFFPDRIIFSDGIAHWGKVQFNLAGTLLKFRDNKVKKQNVNPSVERDLRKRNYPLYVDATRFDEWEKRIRALSLQGSVKVDLDFYIDALNLPGSRADVSVSARDVAFGKVTFPRVVLKGQYAFPEVELTRAVLMQNDETFEVSGAYNFESGLVSGNINNSIVSRKVLRLLPKEVHSFLAQEQIELNYFPRFFLTFSPAYPCDIFKGVAGTFSVEGVSFHGLTVDRLEGGVRWENNRLNLTDLSGVIQGQEEKTKIIGSCMMGGPVNADLFWDHTMREFGLKVSSGFDPLLLLAPLSRVPDAGNMIKRFRFETPPQVTCKMGFFVGKKDSFYTDIQVAADRMSIHGVDLSSVNGSAYYQAGVLRLDPVSIIRRMEFLKGTAELDLRSKTASFDCYGSLNPTAVEDLIFPEFNLFGHSIHVAGISQLSGRGMVNWETMRSTDFSAELKAETLEVPHVRMTDFRAMVSGKGTMVKIHDAVFALHGGPGSGEFSVEVTPGQPTMPYQLDVSVQNADFRQTLDFMNGEVKNTASGKLSGEAHITGDLQRDFFDTANGSGWIKVRKGQLADLPLLRGFSSVMRKIIPEFNIFSLTNITGSFRLKDGVFFSDDVFLEGDVISAKGRGNYSRQAGFDAYVQAQILSDNRISKILQSITDPFLKLFELRLEGSLSAPSWRLDKFSGEVSTPSDASDQ
ncbi:MAG TPA: AsmA-like C-terminal region-containing protein [Pontiella sp.]